MSSSRCATSSAAPAPQQYLAASSTAAACSSILDCIPHSLVRCGGPTTTTRPRGHPARQQGGGSRFTIPRLSPGRRDPWPRCSLVDRALSTEATVQPRPQRRPPSQFHEVSRSPAAPSAAMAASAAFLAAVDSRPFTARWPPAAALRTRPWQLAATK